MTTQGVAPSQVVEESRRWHFASAVLDERTFELIVNGEEIEIERKPFEVLRFLLNHAGEVVTKDELHAGVWPGRFLSDTVLTKCIGRLRKALADDDESIIKTVYGYGYRFVAPVRVEIHKAPEPAHFDFAQGDHPQGRPLWSLVRRLGTGGHGEAWLAQHDKTHEPRVFKFAIDEASLVALKREITLFRFLNDSLGERARVVPLLDWNLEQPPCFIETEYVAGGSLVEWAERSGGLSKVPIATRIEIAAQIAEALAAVHSVGVLHKDLKPSNVLVDPAASAPAIVLADFGSGGVLDPKQLEALGITRLGFTKTMAALGDSAGGTPLYLAPEMLAGQPPTVKADLYALGVMLYQLVVGEFRKAMAPGWEHEVADEVLRECIAHAAHGEAGLRLADAAELAVRLRGLEQERDKRRREREARERAEAAARALERLRARRFGLAIAFGVLIVGLVASTLLYVDSRRARARAELEAARAAAVNQFLSKDVFAPVSSGDKPVKDMTVVQLLLQAGDVIDKRFARTPEIAADIHYTLGRSLDHFLASEPARDHFIRALEVSENLDGPGAAMAVRAASDIVNLSYILGKLQQTIGRCEGVLKAGSARLDKLDPALLELRQSIVLGHYLLGQWTRSVGEFRVLLADLPPQPSAFRGRTRFLLGRVLADLSQYAQSQAELDQSIDELIATEGDRHIDVAEARSILGRVLVERRDYRAAEVQLAIARRLATLWSPDHNWSRFRPDFFTAQMLIDEGLPGEAVPLLKPFVDYQDEHAGSLPDVDKTGTVRQMLAEAYRMLNRPEKAQAALTSAIAASDRADGPLHPSNMSIRLSMVELLLERGRIDEAEAAMAVAPTIMFAELPAEHPFNAQLHRVQGLLAHAHGDDRAAKLSLGAALQIYQAVYGDGHWRTDRVRRELASLDG